MPEELKFPQIKVVCKDESWLFPAAPDDTGFLSMARESLARYDNQVVMEAPLIAAEKGKEGVTFVFDLGMSVDLRKMAQNAELAKSDRQRIEKNQTLGEFLNMTGFDYFSNPLLRPEDACLFYYKEGRAPEPFPCFSFQCETGNAKISNSKELYSFMKRSLNKGPDFIPIKEITAARICAMERDDKTKADIPVFNRSLGQLLGGADSINKPLSKANIQTLKSFLVSHGILLIA